MKAPGHTEVQDYWMIEWEESNDDGAGKGVGIRIGERWEWGIGG